MHTVPLRKVTVIAEALLEDRLLREFGELGARGFTITESRGQGARGIRTIDWEGRNIRIETVVSGAVADAILGHVADHYFEYYAVIAWVEDVEVVRGDKYL